MYFFEDSQVNPVTDYMVYSLVRQNTKETFWDVQEDSQKPEDNPDVIGVKQNQNAGGVELVKFPPLKDPRVTNKSPRIFEEET